MTKEMTIKTQSFDPNTKQIQIHFVNPTNGKKCMFPLHNVHKNKGYTNTRWISDRFSSALHYTISEWKEHAKNTEDYKEIMHNVLVS